MPRGRWVLTSLIPFGWVTWAGFLYAGFRARKPAWIAAGAAYLAVTVATLIVVSLDEDNAGTEDGVGYPIMFAAWGVGILHAFLTRKPFLRRIDMLDDPALQRARLARERQAYARELATADPELAREALIGRS